MSNFHTLDIDFSSYHLVFPYAIGALLVVLLLAMGVKKLITGLTAKSKASDPEESRFRFFDVDFDWKKLFGSLACTVAYVLLLSPLGFLLSSVLFIFGISLVFKPKFTPRALIGPVANAVLTPLVLWLIFGQMFDITLP